MRLGLGLGIDKRRVLSGGGGFTGLLDTYSGAAAAYSIRLLSSTYSGALVEIRRSSDNALKSFYPDANNELSMSSEDGASTSLSSWIGSDNGFIRTWFDQSGNANNAQQTTAANQPQIVNSGALITENSKPSIQLDGVNDNLDFSNITISSGVTNFNVLKPNTYTSSDFWQFIYLSDGTGTRAYGITFSANASYDFRNVMVGARAVSNDSDAINTSQQLISAYYDGTGETNIDAEMRLNGADLLLNTSHPWGSINTLSKIGFFPGGSASNYFEGKVQELIIYASDNRSNYSGIESNQNTYFSIY